MKDFKTFEINLIDDATVDTIKRLLTGLDVDDCIPCLRVASGETRTIERIVIEGNRLIFVAY